MLWICESDRNSGINLIRIGTWNVQYAYQSRLAALADKLAEFEADIWILTETHDDLVPAGCKYFVHAAARPAISSFVRSGSRWVSIWSKFPVRDVTLPCMDRERSVAGLIDQGSAGTLAVYGTVLPWNGDRQIRSWDEHNRIIPIQCDEWRLLQTSWPDARLCVAGDWNTDMAQGRRYGSRTGIEALRQGMRKSSLFCATEPDRVGVELLPVLPIDHIALPLEWERRKTVVSAWPADRVNLSDHSGLVVEIDDVSG
jgi:endonuclease/exonuclease/phosphatase family metal-dependent hydrolase